MYVTYFWNKQNIHINLIGFNRNFDHPHINVATFVPRIQSKSHNFSTMKQFLVEKTFDRYLLFGLSSIFGQNSLTLLKNCYFIVVSFKHWLKYHVWLLLCKVCPSILEKRPNFQNGQKSRKNGTNMDIILSFLAKSVDKHSITLVHITYPP